MNGMIIGSNAVDSQIPLLYGLHSTKLLFYQGLPRDALDPALNGLLQGV
jgi:hypothetical protein